ncbi:MAG: type II secretion system F family protein [Myxococcota bacterium]|nr:type II secretion system F family protein [Myxococcota bacterium]
MATWSWEGKTRSGEIRKGTIEAEDERGVYLILRQQDIMPEKVKKQLRGFQLPKITRGIPRKELVVFVRQFATMVDAGLPLVQCLEIISAQQSNMNFKRVLIDIKEYVAGGGTFAAALQRHPKIFDELFVNLVAAGEIGGILDTILNRLATYIEKNAKLARQVKGAMAYPIGITAVSILVIVVLLKFVIPSFEKMFADIGSELPGLTKIVIGLSYTLRENFTLMIIGSVAFAFAFRAFIKTDRGRLIFDTVMLKLPLFGSLLRRVAVARFTRTMGTMVSSGVPILDALEVVAKAAGNKVIERAIYQVRDRVSEGSSMSEPLAKTQVFPNMVVQMIAVGESTGAMDSMLGKIADFYDEEVEVSVEGLTKLMEPIMLVVLGGIVGTILLAMYLPIFSIAGTAGG